MWSDGLPLLNYKPKQRDTSEIVSGYLLFVCAAGKNPLKREISFYLSAQLSSYV